MAVKKDPVLDSIEEAIEISVNMLTLQMTGLGQKGEEGRSAQEKQQSVS